MCQHFTHITLGALFDTLSFIALRGLGPSESMGYEQTINKEGMV